MWKVILHLPILITLNIAYSQVPSNPNKIDSHGKRIGLWTVMYDGSGNFVEQSDQAEEYWVLKYENDKPIDLVRKYSMDGRLKWEGKMIQDRPKIVLDGEIIEYNDDGTKSISRFYKNGRIANFDDAIKWFENKLETTKSTLGIEHPDYTHYLNCIAISSEKQGLYAKAEPLYQEAIKISKDIFGTDHQNYVSVLHNLGKLYYFQGRYDRAEKIYLETKEIELKRLGKLHQNYATILNNLAALYLQQGQLNKVEPLMQETLEINLKTIGKNHRNYGTSLNNLAIIYARQNKYEEAEPLLIEALEVYKKTLGTEHHQYTLSLTNLARLYSKLDRFEDAEKYFLEGKTIDAKVSGKYHPSYKKTIMSLANLYEKNGCLDRAEPLYIESMEILFKMIDINFTQLSEKEKDQYLATFSKDFQTFSSFIIKRYRENEMVSSDFYNTILITKGLLFDLQQKVKSRILSNGDSTLTQLFQSWQNERSVLADLYHKTKKEQEKSGLDLNTIEERVNNLEKQLSARSSLFTTANDHKRYTWLDVKSKLKPNEAAIELVRIPIPNGNQQDSIVYAALIVTTDTNSSPRIIILEGGNDLEGRNFKFYKNSIQYQSRDTISYHAFWKKIHRSLKGRNTVYIASDGIYHSISLAGLYNPESKSYLVDELDIRPLVSTRSLLSLHQSSVMNNRVRLLGFPEYNDLDSVKAVTEDKLRSNNFNEQKDNSAPTVNSNFITPLPGTKREVDTLNKILSDAKFDVKLTTGLNSTEPYVKSWSSPLIAHIATHGYFLSDDEITSNKIVGLSSDELSNNPLLRSGLLLTNARKAMMHGGDGILTAFEAKSLNLDDTQLVVLSACETGLGHIKNGEGVYGLQRAFQAAGAASVLMSLWTVNDDATQALMIDFYTEWLINGHSKRNALRKAQTKLRHQFAHPYFWSAFVMIGE